MKRSLTALALLAATPFAAIASDLSYNYIEGGYTHINDDFDDGDGLALSGSLALGTRFHLFGGYEALESDRSNVDVDSFHIGFGYNQSLSRSTDLVARLGYINREADFRAGGFAFSSDAESYFTEVGVRSQLAPNFEGYLYAGYEHVKQLSDGDYYGRVGGQYNFNRNWGLVADVKFGHGTEQYFIGPRFTF
jgi:Ax21 family sulfation-dependent quorum factor